MTSDKKHIVIVGAGAAGMVSDELPNPYCKPSTPIDQITVMCGHSHEPPQQIQGHCA
jgi:hypothetical protein